MEAQIGLQKLEVIFNKALIHLEGTCNSIIYGSRPVFPSF